MSVRKYLYEAREETPLESALAAVGTSLLMLGLAALLGALLVSG